MGGSRGRVARNACSEFIVATVRTALTRPSAIDAAIAPSNVEGSLGGETVRKALDQTSWEAASDVIAAWTASGTIGLIRVDIPTIIRRRHEVSR
jgi:hypothetical protein